MAQKRKKVVAKKAVPVKKPGKVKAKPALSSGKKAAKKNVQTGRLVKKAAKNIRSRSVRHSDEWLKKQPKTPAPAPKKSAKKKGKSPRKLPELKFRGKKVPPELAAKIREYRAEAVKHGRFLTNSYVLKKYFDIENQLLQSQQISDDNDPLKIKGKIKQGIDIQPYYLNEVVNKLFDIHQEYGQFTTAIIGFGESKVDKYNSFGSGLRRVDEELSIIWSAYKIYEIKYGLKSPQFQIILAWDPAAKIAFIDFNKTIFISVDADALIDIIISIKGNLDGDFETELTQSQLDDLDKIESEERVKKPVEEKQPVKKAKKKAAKKKAAKKKSAPVKKSAAKKSVAKKAKKKKIIYPRNKQGALDMSYKQNKELQARLDKAKKTRAKNKRAAEKAAKELAKKYAAAAEKRRITIAKKKKRKK